MEELLVKIKSRKTAWIPETSKELLLKLVTELQLCVSEYRGITWSGTTTRKIYRSYDDADYPINHFFAIEFGKCL